MTTSDRVPAPRKPQQPFWKYFLVSVPWALPFAVFFWLLNGAALNLFPAFLGVALIFTTIIRGTLYATERWGVPLLYRDRDPDDVHWIWPGAMYMVMGVLASIVAMVVADLVFWRGFVGGPRA